MDIDRICIRPDKITGFFFVLIFNDEIVYSNQKNRIQIVE